MISTKEKINLNKTNVKRLQIQDRDRRIFKLILEQRFLTRPQIIKHIFRGHESAAKTRLQRLVRDGYLRALKPFTHEPQSYLLGKNGVESVKSGRYAIGKVRGFPVTYGVNMPKPQEEIELANYEHDKKVTEIRFFWEDLGLACDWYSEKFLKMGWRGEKKVPDGFFAVAGKGVAIEVELSAKSSDRYEKILDYYRCDSKIDYVFYICEEQSLLNKICKLAYRVMTSYSSFESQKRFCFTTYDELMKKKHKAECLSHKREPFKLELLLRAFQEMIAMNCNKLAA